MRLYCVSRYSSGAGRWKAGDEVDVDDEVAEFLLRDSPGSFATAQPVEAKRKAKGEPAAGEPTIDVEAATVEELKAFAEANGIELEAEASDEDVRAAVALALEEAAKAKVEAAKAAGTTTNVRPQRRARTR